MRRFNRSGSGPCLLLSLVSVLVGSYVLLRAISRAAKKAAGGGSPDQEAPENDDSKGVPEPQPPGGTVFIKPKSDCVVPLTVEIKDTSNYYILLKFLKLPGDTALPPGPADALCSDIGFFAPANALVSLKVPVGVYNLFYASGIEWRGPQEKFGPGTKYYQANQSLTFYRDGNHLFGNTIRLYPQTDDSSAYRQIDPSEFPG